MAGQLREVMAVICIFIAGFCGTCVTLPQLNGPISFWDGAYLYKMAAPIVKGATTTMQDAFLWILTMSWIYVFYRNYFQYSHNGHSTFSDVLLSSI